MVWLNVFVDLMDLTIIERLHLTHVLWVCESWLLVFAFEMLFSPPKSSAAYTLEDAETRTLDSSRRLGTTTEHTVMEQWHPVCVPRSSSVQPQHL
jgi:hypothetical protein